MKPVGERLAPVIDSTGEIFNLHETGELKYQLRRVLKLFGLELDETIGLIDNFSNMIDVDKSDSDLLPYIANLLGWEINKDIPITAQRREIKNAVATYKRKGTKEGIKTAVAAIIGVDPVIEEMRYRVLETYDPEKFIARTDEPLVWINKGLPEDTNHYTPCLNTGCIYNMNSFVIFIEIPLPEPLTLSKTEKIDRLMLLYNPINTEAFIVLFDIVQDELWNVAVEVVDEDEDEWEDIEAVFLTENIFITNDEDHETNSEESWIYISWFTEWSEDEIIDAP